MAANATGERRVRRERRIPNARRMTILANCVAGAGRFMGDPCGITFGNGFWLGVERQPGVTHRMAPGAIVPIRVIHGIALHPLRAGHIQRLGRRCRIVTHAASVIRSGCDGVRDVIAVAAARSGNEEQNANERK